MKPILALAAAVLLVGAARADWKDLKPGMDYRTATTCAGVPMMQNRGRGGAEVWTYDNRGYIQFQHGRVTYWEAPAVPKPIWSSIAAQNFPPVKIIKPVPGKSVALKD